MRLVLCDDHRLFLESLATALSAHGHHVVTSTNPEEAVTAVQESDPDVCVLDIQFPDGSGLEAARVVRQRFPRTRVLMLSASVDAAAVDVALEAGASGFIRKDQPVALVLKAIERVSLGQTAIDPVPTKAGSRGTRGAEREARRLFRSLTARERQVLRHLMQADDTMLIAERLSISPSTARSHVQNVLIKLGVHSRLQAVTLVTRERLDRELAEDGHINRRSAG
jgi:two-component system, NarL family, nitrate/nitrite response regulator NarL